MIQRNRRILAILAILCVLPCIQANADAASDYSAWRNLDSSNNPPDPAADDSLAVPVMTSGATPDALPKVPPDELKPRGYALPIEGRQAAKIPVTDRVSMTDRDQPPSRLEKIYSDRAAERLHQFGYALFDAGNNPHAGDKARPGMPAGAVQDNFILSAGDRLDVVFRGQRSSRQTYVIDNQGRLLIDDLPPMTAAGRSIAQIRTAIEADVATLPNEQVFISLNTVQQIDVLVAGHVRKPGRQTLTVFDTVLDALEDAGGIDKSGSLRQIRLVRGGRVLLLDLYGLLVTGNPRMDLSLRNGDRLIVPPTGPTLAIAGGVKRPGIYELPYAAPDHARRLSLRETLALSGGLLLPGQVRYVHMNLTTDGQETVRETGDKNAPQFGDGDILSVASSHETRTGTVELTGDASSPGVHALDKAGSLSRLLAGKHAFGREIYPLIGLIERQDSQQMAKQWIAFPPLLASKGKFDQPLQDGDVVHLFSRAQILALQKEAVLPPDVRRDENANDDKTDDDRELHAKRPEDDPDQMTLTDPIIIEALRERSAFVRGAVHQPGAWPVADGVSLSSLIAAAGGMTLAGDPRDVEVTSVSLNEGVQKASGGPRRQNIDLATVEAGGIIIAPGDSVRVNQKTDNGQQTGKAVFIAGQVRHPGQYDLLPGDRLSDLLQRAGGLTREAYAAGTIFSRMSERRAEEERFHAEARNLQLGLAASLHEKTGDKAPNADQIGAVEQLVGQLQHAEGVGRITVEADPDALAADPAVDILLESGDRVFVPQRSLTVRVAGEVLSPANLQFRKDKDPNDYISDAGGTTYNADVDRAFVVYPDGSAQPLHAGLWRHSADFIPPGSTVIVPRDPKPFDFLQTARDVTQILSNLAVTAILVDDIHKD